MRYDAQAETPLKRRRGTVTSPASAHGRVVLAIIVKELLVIARLRNVVRSVRGIKTKVHEGVDEFMQLEVSGSIVLLAATVLAILLANSAAGPAVARFWEIGSGITFGSFHFAQPILHWIDDGLMVVFFFAVGLEIKREVIAGELSTPRKAALPIIAALGGMLVPAAIYALFNHGGPGTHGWGVPMATDIAFALGALMLLGKRIPVGLKVFLSALAIADDLGAVLVIAIFYTAQIHWLWLAWGGAFLLVLVFLNVLHVESPLPYVLMGVAVWFCFLNSGIHPTIAGVLVAFTIPSQARMEPMAFVTWARRKIEHIAAIDVPGQHVLEDPEQQVCAQEIQAQARWVQAPLQRMEHAILPVTTFIILPLFALANAGIRLVGLDVSRLIREPVTLGVFFGLVLGKQIGITSATWFAVKSGLATLPSGVTWKHIYGAGWLGGIGFTMSMFTSGLALRAGVMQEEAKLAILMTSLVAGLGGYLVLRAVSARMPVEDGLGGLSGANVED